MSEDSDSSILESLPPEKLLAGHNGQLIKAALAFMDDAQTVQQYVAYENRHQQRDGILRWLSDRAAELRGDGPSTAASNDDLSDNSRDAETLPGESPDPELLKVLRDQGLSTPATWLPARTNTPPVWNEL